MAYDLYPLEVLETKKKILNEAMLKGWQVVFEHDPYRPVSRIGLSNTKFKDTVVFFACNKTP